MNIDTEYTALTAAMQAHFSAGDGCHDFSHTMRVVHNCQLLLSDLPEADAGTVLIAALLHDIARVGERPGDGCHAKRGAEQALTLLLSRQWPPASAQKVADAIRHHRYRGNNAPQTLEAKILYDADKLDSLGAVGVGRAFLFSGKIGAKLHNTADTALAAAAYSIEDTAYREYLVKLRKLPEALFTEPGRKIAAQRRRIMDDFFAELNLEIYGK